ncbi:hypothetical protein ACT453_60675, partial [Bacillus sp. D-CC]
QDTLRNGYMKFLKVSCHPFNSSSIERMAGHFEKWLHEVSHHPQNPLHDLSMLSEPERTLLLETWNDTVMETSHQ